MNSLSYQQIIYFANPIISSDNSPPFKLEIFGRLRNRRFCCN